MGHYFGWVRVSGDGWANILGGWWGVDVTVGGWE